MEVNTQAVWFTLPKFPSLIKISVKQNQQVRRKKEKRRNVCGETIWLNIMKKH